jgi:peroxiredoxin
VRIRNWLVMVAIIIFCFAQLAFSEEKTPAPDFTLQDLSQKSFTLSNYKDKQAVLLFFWTTVCPFCREELRVLKDTYPELTKEDLVLFAIDAGESALRVNKFAKSYNLPFPILLDKDYAVVYDFGVLGVPTYVLVDKKGYVRLTTHTFPKEKYKSIISE